MSTKQEFRGERPRVRKGTSDLTRVSQVHRVRTKTQRREERPDLRAALDEWAEELSNG